MVRLLLSIFLLAPLCSWAEPPVGEQILHTKSGRELRGVVVSETATGYLFRTASGTELISFVDIQDLLPADGSVAPASPPPPPPPAAAAPTAPAAGHEYPPPPPSVPLPPPPHEPSASTPGVEQPPPPDWRSERRGFHWSLGAGGMVDPGVFNGTAGSGGPATVVGTVAVLPALRWGFGWLDLNAELMPMGYFRGNTRAIFLGFNPQLRINFARVYSLGVGLYSAVVISPSVDFTIGPSVSPAIFRFGNLGQHEVRFWIASPILATSTSLQGRNMVVTLLSYSYVF